MSGGHFDYKQFKIYDIADLIQDLIYNYHYTPETMGKFKIALITLRKAAVMANRIDYLVSGDDGEETFHERWKNDLEELMLGEGLEEHA